MVHVLDHPLAGQWLTTLRDARTPSSEFRQCLRSLSIALFLEASRDLETVSHPVETPLGPAGGSALEAPPLLVPVLRAGLGMVDGILDLTPEARVSHVGLYRDHETLEAVTYYSPRVRGVENCCAFLLDPMLATGGSAVAALSIIAGWGAARAKLISALAAPEGIERVRAAAPEVPIYVGAIDSHLNEVGYIVPGLGDAGDRQFDGWSA